MVGRFLCLKTFIIVVVVVVIIYSSFSLASQATAERRTKRWQAASEKTYRGKTRLRRESQKEGQCVVKMETLETKFFPCRSGQKVKFVTN